MLCMQVGYIVTSCLLNENHDFLRMVINTVRNDIIGRNETFQCLALTMVCSAIFALPLSCSNFLCDCVGYMPLLNEGLLSMTKCHCIHNCASVNQALQTLSLSLSRIVR